MSAPQNQDTRETNLGKSRGEHHPESDSVAESAWRDRIITIPNIICAVRLAGAMGLIWIAVSGDAQLFTIVFTILSLSDWIDGKLARWLNQRSDFGARFDSFADAFLYGVLFFGMTWLRWDVLRPEAAWWVIAFLSYLLTTSAGLWKYRKVPSYHTYGAKLSQWLILFGAICLLMDYSIWPFRIAMAAVTLTNLEATAITWYLKEWRADVLTILHVLPGEDHQTELENEDADS